MSERERGNEFCGPIAGQEVGGALDSFGPLSADYNSAVITDEPVSCVMVCTHTHTHT